MHMEINEIIGKNLSELRKKNGMTQREVAYKLDFSDKSVSKWESGESLPSIDVLCKLAKLFDVKLDYLVSAEHDEVEEVAPQPSCVVTPTQTPSRYRYSRLIISLLSILTLWVAAVCVFVFTQESIPTMWVVFVWAVPASFVLSIIFNSLWGKVSNTFVFVSLFIWTALGAIFFQLMLCDTIFWQIFLIGAPLQLAVFLTANLVLKNKSHDPATIRAKREYKKERGLKRREKLAEKKARLAEEKHRKEQGEIEQAQNQTNDKQQDLDDATQDAQITMDQLANTTPDTQDDEQNKFVKQKPTNIIQDLEP